MAILIACATLPSGIMCLLAGRKAFYDRRTSMAIPLLFVGTLNVALGVAAIITS